MIQKAVNVSWNDYKSQISKTFRNLRGDENFTDVTLVTEDNQQIDAHRVILSASSPFFRTTFERNPHQKPLLYLKDIPFIELGQILDYIYLGECHVTSDRLDNFLRVGEALKIDELTEQTAVNEHQEPLLESFNQSCYKETVRDLRDIAEQPHPIRNKNKTINEGDINEKLETITHEVVCKIGKLDQLLCNVCKFVSADEHKMTNHIKIHGIGEAEEDNKVDYDVVDEITLLKTLKEDSKTLNIQSENWNIRDRHIDLKKLNNQFRTDRLLMKKLKWYVSEKQRPFLGFLRRREEVIMCGDRKRMERIRETPALEKAIKDIFFHDLEELEFNEDMDLPPLNFPFRNASQGWSAEVARDQASLYLHILDFSGPGDKLERQTSPVWWPENVTFRVPFAPSYASKEENESVINSIFTYYGVDIDIHHL